MSNSLGSAFTSEQDSPGFMLWRVTNRWQAIIRAALQPLDLTHVQYVLLAALVWADARDAVTQIELAHRTQVDKMMTSQVLRALEAKGLIERRPHPSDRRARALAVTPAGASLARRASRAVEAADAAFFGLEASRRRTFTQHLVSLDERSRP